MPDSYLQRYAEMPLDDPKRINKVWLPEGRRRPEPPFEVEKMNRQANNHARRAREHEEAGRKLNQLLDYYASTAVPFERIASHLNKSEKFVADEMRQRGRTA